MMKKAICVLMAILPMSALPGPEFPETEITNGLIHARIYLPDQTKGYYRGTRFDWSGVIPELNYKGHSYCGQWFEKYSPTTNDAIMGPVESFSPLGYENAAPGEGFVKIGIGVLARKDGSSYSPFKYYRILNPGVWKIKKSADRVSFIQQVDDTAYAYLYKKEMKLQKDKPELLIIHSLKNTGKRMIETEAFNHNFFLLDKRPVGPGLILKFPFPLTAEEGRGLDDLAAVRGDSVAILRHPENRESLYAVLHGYDGTEKDYDIRLENRLTGAGIRIRCDRPLSRLVCWGSSSIFCPEPYIRIRVLPGETFRWTISYEFNGKLKNGKLKMEN